MSTKKYGNLSRAQITNRINAVKGKSKALQVTISNNARDLKILETRLKEAQEVEKYGFVVPKSFHGFEIVKVGNTMHFGCGAIKVNKTQLKAFLALEAAFSKHWTNSGSLHTAHTQAYNYASRVREWGNGGSEGCIGRFPVVPQLVNGTTKYVVGCGEVKAEREEIVNFYHIYSHLRIAGSVRSKYLRTRTEAIELAKKLLKILN